MNSPMTKDLVIDENGRPIYITTDEMGDLALVIDASDGILLDWGPDDATSRKYAQTKKRTCKSRQDIGDERPGPVTIHLLAANTTPYERCYAVKRARAGDAEFVKALKRLYGEPEFHKWLQSEMARVLRLLRSYGLAALGVTGSVMLSASGNGVNSRIPARRSRRYWAVHAR